MGCGPRGIWGSEWTQLRPHGLRFQRTAQSQGRSSSSFYPLFNTMFSRSESITSRPIHLRWYYSQCLRLPRLSPLPVWWPIINSMSKKKVLIACKGSTYTILFPKKQGFQLGELPFELWAFRVGPTVWVKVINISYSSFFLDSRYGSSTTCTSSIVSKCSYPNDNSFKFCQRCRYKRHLQASMKTT